MHFGIRRLVEIVVPQADGLERLRRSQAEDLIRLFTQLFARPGCSYRYGYDDRSRLHEPQRAHRGLHGRSGCQTIIDDDDGPTFHIDRRLVSAVRNLATLELTLFARGDGVDRCRLQWDDAQHVLVKDAHAAAGDRAHRQLFVARCA